MSTTLSELVLAARAHELLHPVRDDVDLWQDGPARETPPRLVCKYCGEEVG